MELRRILLLENLQKLIKQHQRYSVSQLFDFLLYQLKGKDLYEISDEELSSALEKTIDNLQDMESDELVSEAELNDFFYRNSSK